MKNYPSYIVGTLLAIFGLLTLFLSASILFDLFNVRAKEGNYVLLVVWANFISSILYLFAAYGFILSKKWTSKILGISALILMAAFIGLEVHIHSGNLYERKTIFAMVFRISITLLFTTIAHFTITKKEIMKKITIILAVFNLFILSCNHAGNQDNHDGHQHDNNAAIELNNGKKWKVDDNMMIHIRNMEKDIEAFDDTQQNSYKELVQKLQTNVDLLTSNCTMKGKAHDELHKWLLPYIDLVNRLSEVNNDTEAKKQVEEIKISFNTFNQYFE